MDNKADTGLNPKLITQLPKSSVLLQLIAVLSASLLSLNCGLNFGWPSPSLLELLSDDTEFEISEESASYVVMLSPLAVCIGSPIGGALLDTIGRKNTLLLLAILQIISWICVGVSSYVVLLFVGRILSGVSDGILLTSLTVYICEILQPKVRGYFGSVPTFGICLGSLLMNTYGSFVSIRMAAYISISFPSLFIIVFITMPESPYYLVMKNRIEDARISLKKLRSADEIELELSKISIEVQRQVSEPGRIKHIFTIKSNFKAFLILLGLRTVQQFSGSSAISYYNQVIFKYGTNDISPAISSIIYSAIRLISAGIGSVLVERIGRRPLLFWSTSSSGLILLCLGVYFYFQESIQKSTLLTLTPIILMLMYCFVNTMGLITVPNLIMGEILSVKIKASVLSVVNIHAGICTSISSKLFQWLDHVIGMYGPFFTFGVICLLGTITLYFCVPETKGKTFQEIQEILNTGIRKHNRKNNVSYITKL